MRFCPKCGTRMQLSKESSGEFLVCPRCGSRKIRRLSAFSGWLLPLQYVCEECGYVGVPISVEERGD